MRGKKVKDINKLARELAEGNPLGYKKIRDILKAAVPKSRQRWYQVVHKIMGLCARCDRPLAVGNKEHCFYHQIAVKKAVQARNKRKKKKKPLDNEIEGMVISEYGADRLHTNLKK